jgi:N-methylhydantoinase B
MALRRVYRADADCRVRLDVSRIRSRSWGLFGGLPGGHGGVVAGPGVVFERDNAALKAGQWFEVITPGAGGYGPPAERDRAAVARDLAEDVIDAAIAREVYGFTHRGDTP